MRVNSTSNDPWDASVHTWVGWLSFLRGPRAIVPLPRGWPKNPIGNRWIVYLWMEAFLSVRVAPVLITGDRWCMGTTFLPNAAFSFNSFCTFDGEKNAPSSPHSPCNLYKQILHLFESSASLKGTHHFSGHRYTLVLFNLRASSKKEMLWAFNSSIWCWGGSRRWLCDQRPGHLSSLWMISNRTWFLSSGQGTASLLPCEILG